MDIYSKIKSLALECGFLEIGRLEIEDLKYHPEIRAICEGNGCRNYGTSWACPPAVGTLDECRERVEKYGGMLLFSACSSLDDPFDMDGMRKGWKRFKEAVDRLNDALHYLLDNYFILSNEGCGRCKSCTYPSAPCRYPERLHHSLEGYGFIVSELARDAGIRYNNGSNTVTYFGALLYNTP